MQSREGQFDSSVTWP
nr:unnamed protein product [Callosobruchus chinensis]CAH7732802.1 unnamed protein product [Callosobruchus chinensis]CAH7737143.1 unnamed protein product [Callosobruchus chinensis]CAH7744661.1 unnamed protein product [Callosobruchus chinensis]CAH7749640.1 unnamed protein product [Callosobruchus chinensis]